MVRMIDVRLRLCGLIAVAALVPVSAALAGGFGLSVELPTDRTDAKTRDAVLIVYPGGCHGPGATVSATAEGVVGGRRRSVPLRLVSVATDDQGITRYAVQRQWPTKGVWALVFTGTAHGTAPLAQGSPITCRALLELGPNGSIPKKWLSTGNGGKYFPIRYISGEAGAVETALETLAGNGNKIARSGRK